MHAELRRLRVRDHYLLGSKSRHPTALFGGMEDNELRKGSWMEVYKSV
jgi:hypothetical protein